MAGFYLNIKSVWIYLLLVAASNVSCLKCFDCGPLELEQHKRTCDHFNSNPDLFLEDCQEEYSGCSTAIQNGTVVERQCDVPRVSTCHELDSKIYCFCISELCNGADYLEHSQWPFDDDEDMEGSGTNQVFTETTIIPTVDIKSSSMKLSGTIIILAVLLHF